jgi:integrase
MADDIPTTRLPDIQKAAAASTLRCYTEDWKSWLAWCGPQGIDPLHCTVADLSTCLREWYAAGLSLSTINRRKAAVSYYQQQAGVNPAANHYAMRAAMSEIRRTAPPQRGKLPLGKDDIDRIMRDCEADPKKLRGLRDRAIFMVMWSCCLRRSRLVTLLVADLSGKRRIPNLSDEARGAAIEWLQAARITDGRLFRSLRLGGKVGNGITDDAVARIVKNRCTAIGKSPGLFSAGSVRSGRVVHEVQRGTGVRKLMTITRPRGANVVSRAALLRTPSA